MLAGIVAIDGSEIDREIEFRICRTMASSRRGPAVARIEGAVFVQETSPAGGEVRPIVGRHGRELFAAIVRLDNRYELGSALALAPEEFARTTDAMLIYRMQERWGDAGVARCLGAFAFASWDADARRLTLARDCLGNRLLFFHRAPQFVAFATTLGALFALPGVPRDIDEIGLANFIAVNVIGQRRTLYHSIERVPSRTLVTIDAKAIDHRRYWTPNFDADPPYMREEDYVERARELLDVAVSSAARDTQRLAIATSGGLDSSAIAATAARLGIAESITCYSLVPLPGTKIDVGPFRYLDERDKVEALMRMHPSLRVKFIAGDPGRPTTEEDASFFARSNLPTFDPVGLGLWSFLTGAVTADDHRGMLVGGWGNHGLSWRGTFSLAALLRARQWSGFAKEMRATARECGRSLPRTFADDVIMPTVPAWMRRLIYRLRGRDPDSVARHSALNPVFVAEAGLARRWRVQGFDPWFGVSEQDGARWRAARMFDYNQYGRDLRGLLGQITGCEVRDPQGDRRLLEFTLSVPEPLFRRDGIPRSFARKVLADRLPTEILNERRSGAHQPNWFTSLNASRAEIAGDIERLEASPLARRLVDLPRLKDLMARWPRDEQAAEKRRSEYNLALARGVHVGRFIRWVEGGNQ